MEKRKNKYIDEKNKKSIELQVKADYFKSKKIVFLHMNDHEFRPKIAKTLTENGTRLAMLSMISLPFITYLMGLCDEKTFNTYRSFELRYLTRKLNEQKKYLKKKYRKIPNIELEVETPDFWDVLEYAKGEGYIIPLSKVAFEKAIELKRTAGLFEMLKTNVNDFMLNFDTGLPHSNWYDPFSQEETQYAILNELILLHKTLYPHSTNAFEEGLNQLIMMRWQKHLSDLKELKIKYADDESRSLRISCAISTLKNMVPIQLKKYSEKEKKILLYQTIQKAKEAVSNYPDKDLREGLENWLNFGVKEYENSLFQEVKQAPEIELKNGLSKAFLLSFEADSLKDEDKEYEQQEEIIEDAQERIKAEINEYISTLVTQKSFLSLPQEEKNVLLMKNYYKTVFNTLDEHLKKMYQEEPEELEKLFEGVTKEHKGLVYVAELPDIYSYFILGIITKQQADDFYEIQEGLFLKKGIQKLDEIFDDYVNESDGCIDEPLEEAYEAYKTGKETGDYKGLDLNSTLLKLGVSEYEIEEMEPSVQDTLSYLLNEDFNTYLPLALRFKKEYFNLVDNFKEMAIFLMDIEKGEKWLSIQSLRIPDTCIDETNLDKTRINRLTAICDIYSVMTDYVGGKGTSDFLKARILLQKMIYACYQKTLSDLNELPPNTRHSDVTAQLRAMSRYFMEKYPVTNVLGKEEENMAFLANVARSCLLSAAPSQNIEEYYLANFDKKFGSDAQEDEKLSGRKVSRFQLARKILDTMDKGLFSDFKNDLYNSKFDEDDRIANAGDQRCIFGVCTDVPLLYAMGILSNFEYERAIEIDNQNEQDENDRGSFILNIKEQLRKEEPPFYLRITREHLDVMKQIRLAGSLIDCSYIYDKSLIENVDYKNDTAPSLKDYQKNALRSEGIMLDSILAMSKALIEEDIHSSPSLRVILDSYWKESTQLLNQLAVNEENKHPDIAKRICHQKPLFGLKKNESFETVINRLAYYSIFLQEMRRALSHTHIGGEKKCVTRKRFFEKLVAPFVQFYAAKEPGLKFRGGNDNTLGYQR